MSASTRIEMPSACGLGCRIHERIERRVVTIQGPIPRCFCNNSKTKRQIVPSFFVYSTVWQRCAESLVLLSKPAGMPRSRPLLCHFRMAVTVTPGPRP